jgi:hypothetical protein
MTLDYVFPLRAREPSVAVHDEGDVSRDGSEGERRQEKADESCVEEGE